MIYFVDSAHNRDLRSKAVSDGAIGYYLEHLVSSRIARATYGTPVATRFNPFDPEHRKRIDLADLSFSGIVFEDGFSMLVKKVSRRYVMHLCGLSIDDTEGMSGERWTGILGRVWYHISQVTRGQRDNRRNPQVHRQGQESAVAKYGARYVNSYTC